MSTGYTYKALIGFVRNDGSNNFIDFTQRKNIIYYATKQSVLSGGAAAAETSVSTASFVPSVAKALFLEVDASNGAAATRNLFIRWKAGANYYRQSAGSAITVATTAQIEIPNVSQNVYYEWSGASCSANLNVCGVVL
jgi:hypothetical protein